MSSHKQWVSEDIALQQYMGEAWHDYCRHKGILRSSWMDADAKEKEIMRLRQRVNANLHKAYAWYPKVSKTKRFRSMEPFSLFPLKLEKVK